MTNIKKPKYRLIKPNIKYIDQFIDIWSNPKMTLYDEIMDLDKDNVIYKLITENERLVKEKKKVTFFIVNNNILIGNASLYKIDLHNKKAEIGLTINYNYWNKGYATSVIKDLLKIGFEDLKLNRIEGFVQPKNIASKRVLEKTGFIKEGYLRQNSKYYNKLKDEEIYAILKKDYFKR
jgi:[ribosomal protein S5]-alanine N-acetyltransferase